MHDAGIQVRFIITNLTIQRRSAWITTWPTIA